MRNQFVVLAAGFAIAGSAFAAAPPDLSKLPPPADKPGLTYEKDIRPLFEASCFRCHGNERPRADLRLDTLAAVLKGGEDGKVVIPGRSKDSILIHSIAQLDDETAMPPKRDSNDGPTGRLARDAGSQRDPGGPGGTNRPSRSSGTNAPGGRGGFGFGFGSGNEIAAQMLTQADKDGDKKLTKAELTALANTWFDKLDTNKVGKVTQQQFAEKSADLVPRRQGGPGGFGGGAGGGPMGGGQRGGGLQNFGGGPPGERASTNSTAGQRPGGRGFGTGARSFAPGLFTMLDADKDGSLTRTELTEDFGKWLADWDKEKAGTLTEDKLRDGLNAALPPPDLSGLAALAGAPGFGGFGGPGGRGNSGPPPKPLTPEQVGLVRAWIDQGAK